MSNIVDENSTVISESTEVLEAKITKNFEDIFGKYFEMYLSKFDKFIDQASLAEVMLNAYSIRFKKIADKVSLIDDFFEKDSQFKKEFLAKNDKLNKIDSKLSKIEGSTQLLLNRMNELLVKKKEMAKSALISES